MDEVCQSEHTCWDDKAIACCGSRPIHRLVPLQIDANQLPDIVGFGDDYLKELIQT